MMQKNCKQFKKYIKVKNIAWKSHIILLMDGNLIKYLFGNILMNFKVN